MPEVLLPADTEHLNNAERANFQKLVGLLLVFLIGCGCWAAVWHRNQSQASRTGGRQVQIEHAMEPQVELIQQARQGTIGSDRQ